MAHMRTHTIVPVFFSLLGISAGCAPTTATVDGHTLDRPNLSYTDHQLYALEHRAAYPGWQSPSSGLHTYGGTLSGRVCGVDMHLDADYYGRYLDVSGYMTPRASNNTDRMAPR